MRQNIGTFDRALRVVLGLALLAFAFLSGHAYAWAGWIGLVPILTALVGYCPLYAIIGISTGPAKSA